MGLIGKHTVANSDEREFVSWPGLKGYYIKFAEMISVVVADCSKRRGLPELFSFLLSDYSNPYLFQYLNQSYD